MRAATEGLGLQSILSDFDVCGHAAIKSDATAAIGMVHRLGLGKVRHLAVGDLWIQHHVRSGKIRVSKNSGLENPSDAQTKYLGPEPLQRRTKACHWVPVDAEEKPTTKVGQDAYFADGDKMRVGSKRLAAVGRCFPTPDLIARRGARYARKFICRWLC